VGDELTGAAGPAGTARAADGLTGDGPVGQRAGAVGAPMGEVDPADGGLVPRSFFDRPSDQVAPDLLGCVLEHETQEGLVAVALTEVEAYRGATDAASHAYRGPTKRNAVMFGPSGHAYVYFTYGMHFCVNLVCLPPGTAEAVLLRAGSVVAGAPLARSRRLTSRRDTDLARGPALLCQALAIDRAFDGADVCAPSSPLRILGPRLGGAPRAGQVRRGPRVGVSGAADLPLRFWIDGDPTVSVYRPRAPRRRPPGKPVTASRGESGSIQP
jgi:DNA-3-methyladenine glycosylase